MRSKLLSVMALFVISLFALPLVSALSNDAFQWQVEVNGDEVFVGEVMDVDTNGDGVVDREDVVGDVFNVDPTTGAVSVVDGIVPTVTVEEGQAVDIEVSLFTNATEGAEDVEASAKIKGYEYSRYEPMSDSTRLFDMAANTQKTVRLSVDLPRDLEKDVYWLHLTIDSANSRSVERVVKLNVEPARHGVDIADVSFSPGNTVKAVRSLLASVLLENFGQRDEDNVKVTVEIPGLGVKATEYVDEVKVEDQDNGGHDLGFEDVAEMFLPIPADAAEGDYEVKVTVQFDNLRDTVTKSYTLHVKANEAYLPGKLVL